MVDILSIEKTILPSHARRAVHLAAISRAIKGEYVVSGGYVQQHASVADMSVDVDAISSYRYGGSDLSIAASTVVIDAADEELHRIDILYIDAAGALAVAKGTEGEAVAESPGSTAIADWLTWTSPSPPDMSSTPGVILAEILVPAGKTQIIDDYIRMLGQPGIGITGTAGADGADGLSVLVLAVPPTASDGVDGQLCIDYVAGMLYGPKAAGAWPTGVSIFGAAGADGVDGADGLDILVLATSPTASDGVDGQMCIDYTNSVLWGPKAAGAWPATGVNLIGDAGIKADYNTAVGDGALEVNEGVSCSAFGYDALTANTTGGYNTAVGAGSLAKNTTGVGNVAVGASALAENLSGSANVAIGAFTLAANVTGGSNVAVGKDALNANTTGSYNVAIGYQAMRLNTIGVSNVAIGHEALEQNTTGVYNLAMGYRALTKNVSGGYNVALGYQALTENIAGDHNVAIGHNVLAANTTGISNVALGYQALKANTVGMYNTAAGDSALEGNTIGVMNAAIGYLALQKNTTGSFNVAVGANALVKNTTGDYNVAVGQGALYENTVGRANVGVGNTALASNVVGEWNTAVGNSALFANLGSSNTAIGAAALSANTTGVYNVAVGDNALAGNTTGNSNVAVGKDALLVATGRYNTGVGKQAGSTLTTGNNVTCIGYNAQPSGATTTNEIVLGDTDIARLRCNVTTITALSDERDKTAIEDLPLGLAFLRDLRPRKFQWHKRIRNEDGTLGARGELGAVDFGFVAQELATALSAHDAGWTDMILSMRDGEVLETTTGKLLPIMVKAIQELAAENTALTARITALEAA
jgi:hypothetical protein